MREREREMKCVCERERVNKKSEKKIGSDKKRGRAT